MKNQRMLHVVGIVGLPGQYGGFETLVDNLIESDELVASGVVVYCEAAVVKETGSTYKGVTLRPLIWKANGWQSIVYDAQGMFVASLKGADVLILGASAAFFLPFLRLFFPRTRFFINMAGLEWKRSKWGRIAKFIIKLNEWASARFAHKLIADNEGLVEYVKKKYNVDAVYIAYGGDQYLDQKEDETVFTEWNLPAGQFDFAMARAQSDNNLELILDAYTQSGETLVFISNWDSSQFGKAMRIKYSGISNLHLVGPIYDLGKVKAIQLRTRLYVHGHSAGGTNPALVEAMWAGLPTFAYDVSFNRHTTDQKALYFANSADLVKLIKSFDRDWANVCGVTLREIAQRKYRWSNVRIAYLNLFKGEL
jgi:glycosyltransferase involved in cell wall biosynthesis